MSISGFDAQAAAAAVREAGALALRHFEQGVEAWEKLPGQILTQADIEVNELLESRLKVDGDGWLSEESPPDPERLGACRVWIVDPIDGTRSFAKGKPEFAVSVALLMGGDLVWGAVFNPAREAWFEAHKGRGFERSPAEGDGETVLVSGREAKEIVTACWPPDLRIKGVGSIAYRLAQVASGRADAAVTFRRIADWDIAAALVLLREAGIRVTDAFGHPVTVNAAEPYHRGLIAGTDVAHARLREIVTQRRAGQAETS